jgi:hypothetical protein
MRCNVNRVFRRDREAGCQRWVAPWRRVFGVVVISIGLLSGGVGCGRKGPLIPLKKEPPPYNFMHIGCSRMHPFIPYIAPMYTSERRPA